MHLKKKVFNIALIILVVMGGSFFFFNRSPDSGQGQFSERAVSGGSGNVREVGNEKLYRSTNDFGFLFRVPSSFSIGEFDEGGGRVVLVNTDTNSSIQIFISDYGESAETLTFEKIAVDVPGLVIREPETMLMTGGEQVLTFIGEDTTFGITREVWLVHRGNLFQILTTIEDQEALAKLLETWELF